MAHGTLSMWLKINSTVVTLLSTTMDYDTLNVFVSVSHYTLANNLINELLKMA